MKVIVVTDPMCSWCWGMAPDIEQAASRMDGEVEFDFLLGGINTHASQFIGDYGARHLFRIWHEVAATTGQSFGFRLPERLVYNSRLSCVAVHVVRRKFGTPPFGYLHRLQQAFFMEARNINDADVLADAAVDFGCEREAFLDALKDARLLEQVTDEFALSRGFGTNALPSVLWEVDGVRSLLAGGYADAEMLVELIEAKKSSLARA
ncbi:MAG: DsbA family protein [Pseudomonadales bacterium]